MVDGLAGKSSFIRAERARLERVEWDEATTTWKFNPLADWSADRIATYQAEHRLPPTSPRERGVPLNWL